MSRGSGSTFSTKDEEILYWKNLATEYLQDAERIQKESDEFISESQQLDREYEATIDQNEKKIKELSLANNRAQIEIESLRNKLEQINKENISLQTEVQSIKTEKIQMSQYIRDLEQKNDDLERSRRIIEESIAGIETAFHSAIERNAMLESEVDEKESLKEKLQRLADETRDLKQELLVKEKERGPDNERILNGFQKNIIDSNRLKENETQTTPAKLENTSFTTTDSSDTVYSGRFPSSEPTLSAARRPPPPKAVFPDFMLTKWLCSECGQVKCTSCLPNNRKNGSINMEMPRRSRSSTKNSPSPSLQGVTK